MRSPTTMSLKLLRDQGYVPYVTEHWNAYARVRKDLYGFIDMVALHTEHTGLLGVQTTTGTNLSARIKKAEGIKAYYLWLVCGNDVEFHGWRKILKKKGGKLKIWAPRIVRVSYKDFLQ